MYLLKVHVFTAGYKSYSSVYKLQFPSIFTESCSGFSLCPVLNECLAKPATSRVAHERTTNESVGALGKQNMEEYGEFTMTVIGLSSVPMSWKCLLLHTRSGGPWLAFQSEGRSASHSLAMPLPRWGTRKVILFTNAPSVQV